MFGNKYFMVVFFLLCVQQVFAQSDSVVAAYPAINENLFVNTKWQYTYTTHAESNTIIHKAEEDYEYFIFLNMITAIKPS